MSRAWRFSNRAKADLATVFRYSADMWGGARAEAYLADLLYAVAQAHAEPWRVRRTEVGTRSFLRLKAGQHILYAEEAPGGPVIRRVLHAAQDPLAGL